MKLKHTESQFEKFLEDLSENQVETLSEFFTELKRHVLLSKIETADIIKDFENAIIYYTSQGFTLDEALSRLDISNLGGFYARPSRLWFALDNGAKIYPLSMKHGYMSVFRLSVYLKEDVIPEILQMALTFTIKRFPSFATTVKKGFFWHYLDATKRRYYIEPETYSPCHMIKVSNSGSQSFRVLYYNKRISVEYFHILTDGTGGLIFLKTLLAEYLRLLGVDSTSCDGVLDVNAISTATETSNEFYRAKKSESTSAFIEKSATQFGGKISRQNPCRVIHYKMNADELKAVAKKKKVTVTAYILSLMFVAGRRSTDETAGDFNIQIPVNMRKFYPSDTVRNFIMYCGIRLPVAEITDTNSILENISQQLTTKASKESTSEMMASAERLVNMVRYIPLTIKSPVVRYVHGFFGDKVFSSIFSNLGVVTIPPELKEYVDYMDFVLGPALTNRVCCSMITIKNTATLTVSKSTVDPSFEEAIYDLLTLDGINPVIEGSELYES